MRISLSKPLPEEGRIGAPGKPSAIHMRMSTVAKLLGGYRYRYGSEVQLHERMGDLLAANGFEFEREYRLDAQNRADFWLDGIVIEVKVDGTLGDALRQVDRYINLPQVHGVLLAATPKWATAHLSNRPAWQGKAFHLTRLQRQAL